MKPLRHADEEYKENGGEIQAGDYVVYEEPAVFEESKIVQEIESPLGEIETYKAGMIPVTTIKVFKVESVDLDNSTFKAEEDDENKPLYRVNRVVKDSLAYLYKGYDFARIEVDKGAIDIETYHEIKEMRERFKNDTNNKT